MKKIYSVLISLLPLFSLAQPTITQSDLPVAGTGWRLAKDTNYVDVIPAGGAGVTWDYTGLLPKFTDTTGWEAASASPYASLFAASNLTAYSATDTTWSFFETNSTGFYADGIFFPNTGTIYKYNVAPQLYIPVPFTYNNTRNDYAQLVLDSTLGTNCGRFIHHVNSSMVADGWGTLKIPTGTYSNVLRIKITELTLDTTLVSLGCTGSYAYYSAFFPATATQVTHYRYIKSGSPSSAYLLGIDADSLATVTTASEYFLNGYTGVSVNDLPGGNHVLNVYPNPANDEVHFVLSGNDNTSFTLKVYDITGREIYIRNTDGLSSFDVPVAEFESGIYSYSLSSDHAIESGKFTVVH